MRAVWSFWSRPFDDYYKRAWLSEYHHLLAWVISVNFARQHYPDTMLVTDIAGKRLLVDELGLPFKVVSTELERLRDVDLRWWTMGKLVAYSLQTEPFVHVDADVFLWKRLPLWLEETPVIVQHPEHFSKRDACYQLEAVEASMRETGGIIPEEWSWTHARGPHQRAENCGICGGADLSFLNYYANLAMLVALRPENQAGWRRLRDTWMNMVVEQNLLTACIEYHRHHQDSPFRGVRHDYLFDTAAHAFDPALATRAGFTHLISNAKRNPAVAQRIEARVRRDFPGYIARCRQAVLRAA
ncbi:hypothetical protein IQ288_31540 [Burkholderia sp. R-69980]|nr:hypothetical protein [Burkholderia sp. R-69980]